MLRTTLLVTALALVACDATVDPAPSAVRASLEEVFETVAVVPLEEEPQDSIAEPGIFAERADGGFLLSDRHLPRVRSYDTEGRLGAGFGRFGEGPFEFRGINGLTEARSGRIALLDSGLGRLTWLTGDLLADTTLAMPGQPSRVKALGDDLVVDMRLLGVAEGPGRFFSRPMELHRFTENGVAWSGYRLPFRPIDRPYWMSLGRLSFDVGGDSIYAAFSFRYPIVILDATGDSVGAIGTPPPSFDPVPVLAPGALSPGVQAARLTELLGGKHIISHIAVVGPRLVVVHGRWGVSESSRELTAHHALLDVYDRHTGRKLYEDVRLPMHTRVMGGGRHLYLLRDTRFPPWRIAKLGFRDDAPRD